MFSIVVYKKDFKNEWDEFIKQSKNGTFLFLRNYMDYHSDRFDDCSFLIYKKNKPVAVIPGNIKNDTFYTHQGLTYGGLVMNISLGTKDVLDIFELLNHTLKIKGIKEVIYKRIPHVYHHLPSEEDTYALFRLKAIKQSCAISSTIMQANKLKFIESRKSGVRKSIKENVRIIESNDYGKFWHILNANLTEKHNTNAVHNVEEMINLSSQFPDNIKLHVVLKENEIIAGTVLFIMKNIIHVQYLSASNFGKEIGALDFLFHKLINEIYLSCPIFDFGHSTENSGNFLNENLIFQKEGFGGRGIVYETYSYSLV